MKLKLVRDELSKLTPNDLYLISARAGVIEFFNSLALGSNKSSAINRAIKTFSQVWDREIDRTIEDTKDKISFYNGSMMVTMIGQIYNEEEDEVVATNFPLIVPIYNILYLHDKVDILLINTTPSGKKTIRGISLENGHPWDNERYFSIRASVFRLAVQSYLGGSGIKRHYSYESRPLNASANITDANFIDVPVIYEICSKVSMGIDKSIFFPTMSREVCKGCAHKYSCDLSLVRLNK